MSPVRLAVLAVVLCGALCPPVLTAAPPWQALPLFSRVECDPDNPYTLTDQHGPWLIMAVTFSGEGAEKQAHDLVLELRRREHLPAWVHEMTFKHDMNGARQYTMPVSVNGQEQTGLAQELPGDASQRYPRRRRYRNEEIREVAVLVGEFPSVDDPQAQRLLERVKFAQPECLQLDRLVAEGGQDHRSLGAFRLMQQAILAPGSRKRERGPMGHAFITANPLLPEGYLAPRGVDDFVVGMNRGVEHSLLDCPGRYTVQVATFRGSCVIDQNLIRRIEEEGGHMPSQLEQAAWQAHRMTEALRAKGWEAFEFHDRYASIVTVGSFEEIGSQRADGKTEINPAVHQIMQTFGATEIGPDGVPRTGQPKRILDIPFDVQPLPVEAPRRAFSADYARESN